MSRVYNSIRISILVLSGFLSLMIWLSVIHGVEGKSAQIVKLTQIYALLSVGFLYVTLWASPFVFLFPKHSFNGLYIHARRSFGLSACYFALLHSLISFFGQLAGFSGFVYLAPSYFWAVTIGFVALALLLLLALTSFDKAVQKLTFDRWKLIHRLVYGAGLLILIHTLMLGTHFADITSQFPQIFLLAITILLIAEAFRLAAFLQTKFSINRFIGRTSLSLLVIISMWFIYATPNTAFNVHSQHQLGGDIHAHYDITILNQSQLLSKSPSLQFQFYDVFHQTSSAYFNAYELQVVVVNEQGTYFFHDTPTVANNAYIIHPPAMKPGIYYLYGLLNTHSIEVMATRFSVGHFFPFPSLSLPVSHLNRQLNSLSVTLQPRYYTHAVSPFINLMTFIVNDPQDEVGPIKTTSFFATAVNNKTKQLIYLDPITNQAFITNHRLQFVPILDDFTKGTYTVFFEFPLQGRKQHLSFPLSF